MNEQKASSKSSIEWTRIRNPDGTVRRGWTWNPVGGCLHDCKWTMPDGKVAGCYAKTFAEEGLAKSAYPQGFEHHYWREHLLKEPLRLKEPAGIFLDSMADLMGHWTPDEQVQQVLNVCREAAHHTFILLTKNAPRLLKFEFPPNVWVGVSSPPDWFMGKELSDEQKRRMLQVALETLGQVKATTFMSFEPLSWDVSEVVARYPGALDWAIIGAASDGNREYPPFIQDLFNLLNCLDRDNVPVFFKGNLKALGWAKDHWRAEFPNPQEKPIRVGESPYAMLPEFHALRVYFEKREPSDNRIEMIRCESAILEFTQSIGKAQEKIRQADASYPVRIEACLGKLRQMTVTEGDTLGQAKMKHLKKQQDDLTVEYRGMVREAKLDIERLTNLRAAYGVRYQQVMASTEKKVA